LSLSAGLRTDGNNYSDKMKNILTQISPRFSVSYFLNEKLSVNFNTGRYYQLPAYTTLGFKDNDGVLINKQNNLSFIQSDHVIGGFEYNPNRNWKMTIEGFYKKYNNYPVSKKDSINLASKDGDFGVIGNEAVTSNGKGRAYGFELFSQLRSVKGWSNIVSYTFVISEFQDYNGGFISSTWDNRHILTISAQKEFKRNWNFGFKWRFAGGLPFTPYDMEKTANVLAWSTQGRAFIDYSSINSDRLPVFHQLDIRVDKRFYFKNWYFSVYFDVQNAYNFQSVQPDYVLRVFDEQGSPVIENPNDPIEQQRYKLKSLPNSSGTVLPTLGIMVKF